MNSNFHPSRAASIVLGTATAAAAVIATYARFVRPWTLHWGATPIEVELVLPGDEMTQNPLYQATRAMTIHAPVANVWRQLVQAMQDRSVYNQEWQEVWRAHRSTSETVQPQDMSLQFGDYVLLYPDGPGYAVSQLKTERLLVLQTVTEGTGEFTVSEAHDGVHGTIAFGLEPLAHGTRLIVRTRCEYTPTFLSTTVWGIREPIQFAMERELMQRLKQGAEQDVDPVRKSGQTLRERPLASDQQLQETQPPPFIQTATLKPELMPV